MALGIKTCKVRKSLLLLTLPLLVYGRGMRILSGKTKRMRYKIMLDI